MAGRETEAEGADRAARRASMRDVADLAGVAMSSVSRVLSGHADVSAAMRDRVLAAVDQLGYEPDFLAQSLRRGATLSVGFVVGDISNPLIADIASGAEQTLRAAGYSMLVMNSENDPRAGRGPRPVLRGPARGRADPVAGERADTRDAQALADGKLPLVLVDRELPPRFRVSAVRDDHRNGLARGHRGAPRPGPPPDRPRHRAAEDISPVRRADRRHARGGRRAGTPGRDDVRPGSLSAEHGETATEALLALGRAADGDHRRRQPAPRGLPSRLRQARRPPGPRHLAGDLRRRAPRRALRSPHLRRSAGTRSGLGREAAELLLRHLSGDWSPRTVILPMSSSSGRHARPLATPVTTPRPRIALRQRALRAVRRPDAARTSRPGCARTPRAPAEVLAAAFDVRRAGAHRGRGGRPQGRATSSPRTARRGRVRARDGGAAELRGDRPASGPRRRSSSGTRRRSRGSRTG